MIRKIISDIAQIIFEKEIGKPILEINEIKGLGDVNNVFKLFTNNDKYIVRINDDENRCLEFKKEKWCLDQVKKLGIQTPNVISTGIDSGFNFMIQDFIEGRIGVDCKFDEKEKIWFQLGKYASKYHQIKRIDIPDSKILSFHENLGNQLSYNLKILEKENDSLLDKNIFNKNEYVKLKRFLIQITEKKFKFGLIHKDLSLRNIILKDDKIFLLDWGMAEISIVPHLEIGSMITSEEVNEKELSWFLKGLGMRNYPKIEAEIRYINLLDRLDKYRWAEDHQVSNIDEYVRKLRMVFDEIEKMHRTNAIRHAS